jgi:hypothetical protein
MRGGNGRRLRLAVALMLAAVIGVAFFQFRSTRPIRIATGTVAQTLCAEVFVSPLNAGEVYRKTDLRLVGELNVALPSR